MLYKLAKAIIVVVAVMEPARGLALMGLLEPERRGGCRRRDETMTDYYARLRRETMQCTTCGNAEVHCMRCNSTERELNGACANKNVDNKQAKNDNGDGICGHRKYYCGKKDQNGQIAHDDGTVEKTYNTCNTRGECRNTENCSWWQKNEYSRE